MNFLVVGLLILWIYSLMVFGRARLDFWMYLVGSVGFFVFYVIIIMPIILLPLQNSVAAAAGVLGYMTGVYSSYFQYGILFIDTVEGSLSLYIDYECSG